jgi:hypothetical protein
LDQLYLNTLGFPVRKGTLYRSPKAPNDYCWEIEICCDESPQLNYRDWPDDRPEGPDDWLAGASLLLAAQRLPLRVQSPDELIGRDYRFPPLEESPAEWADDPCWPYFFLYVWEWYPAEPLRVTFISKRDRQYRVEIAGEYASGEASYKLRVQAWLDWLTEGRRTSRCT